MALVVKAMVEQKLITGVSGTGTKTILETMISSMPPEGVNEDDVVAWAAFAQTSTTLYGPDTASIQFETGNKRSKETEKIRIFKFFVGAISHHPTLNPLVELVPDEKTGGMSLWLFTILRGDPDPSKKRVLNACILVWARNFWKNGFAKDNIRGIPQPNYTDKCIKHIFKVLHDQCVYITHFDMKNFSSSYWFHLEKNFAKAAKVHPNFGRKPNQSTVEHHDELKIRNDALSPYWTDEQYEDLKDLVLYKFNRDLFNRDGDEVRKAFCFFFIFISRFLTTKVFSFALIVFYRWWRFERPIWYIR
jgi:hypothetical protein